MAMTNIVINDGATTPVSHTFTPQTGQSARTGFAQWFEKLATKSAQAWPEIKTRVTLAEKPGQEHVSTLHLSIPAVSVVDGAEVLIGATRFFVTAITPYNLNSEDAAKANFGLLKNALAHAEATGVFVTQKPSQ
jgi:hypothetical protein